MLKNSHLTIYSFKSRGFAREGLMKRLIGQQDQWLGESGDDPGAYS
jgi:hypothetical protein